MSTAKDGRPAGPLASARSAIEQALTQGYLLHKELRAKEKLGNFRGSEEVFRAQGYLDRLYMLLVHADRELERVDAAEVEDYTQRILGLDADIRRSVR